MHKKTLLALLIPLLLSGCYSAASTIANTPAYVDSTLHRQQDIAYGAAPQQKLDIYHSTASPEKTKLPVIIFLHGGKWTTGNKNQYRFVAADLTKAGYVVVIPNYIKYPAAKFPAFMDDAARATAWVQQHIAAYGGNPSQLYLMGHSSGAHMAAILISDRHYLAKYNSTPASIKAFVGLAGPYAFTPDEPDLRDMFAPPSAYPAMQVPTYITGKEPPMLLLYGGADSAVGLFNLTKLADAIHTKGGIVETKVYPDVGHIGIIRSMSWLNNGTPPTTRDAVAFFERYR